MIPFLKIMSHSEASIENFFCIEKNIHQTVQLERMKVNVVIFSEQFIFHLVNKIDITTV